jgi:poly-gamma-glutamate synthesis protein (capsule biosynthesis protein)
VNLGRRAGQILLSGDTLHPWLAVRDTFARYDVVFANLESNLSEQGGRTVDPRSNIVFTGPPSGAVSLARGGVTVVATANNHATDFGLRALQETIYNLDSVGVRHVGTSATGEGLFDPVYMTVNGIRLAFLACTDVMNDQRRQWRKYVAIADTTLLFPAIRRASDSADVVILSFHGGDEYTAKPTPRVTEFARAAVRAGVDLFLGHHPHVPHGMEITDDGYIIHSLGNFVFKQPGNFWTEHSYAVAVEMVRDSSGMRISPPRILPVACGFQPRFLEPGPEADAILERVRALSRNERDLMEQSTW